MEKTSLTQDLASNTGGAGTMPATGMLGTLKELGRELWHDKTGMFGLLVILVSLYIAIVPSTLATHDPNEQMLAQRLTPPFWYEKGSTEHLLGTDHLGRDVYSRMLHGARISIIVGVGQVATAGTFGVIMGMLAGYFGGRVDIFVMRWVDTQLAFPGLLLALVILAVVGPSVGAVIAVLALNGWMVYARITRGIVLSVREKPYVEAAELIGCRPGRVIFRHILPNLMAPLLTLGILEFARIVLAEAALSFLGYGVQPPLTSWGLDVANGRNYMFIAWWMVTFPG